VPASRLPAVQQNPNRIGTEASLRPPLELIRAEPRISSVYAQAASGETLHSRDAPPAGLAGHADRVARRGARCVRQWKLTILDLPSPKSLHDGGRLAWTGVDGRRLGHRMISVRNRVPTMETRATSPGYRLSLAVVRNLAPTFFSGRRELGSMRGRRETVPEGLDRAQRFRERGLHGLCSFERAIDPTVSR
jgi:hypothetical protein